MSKLTLFSVYNAMESLTRQLLATPSRLYAPWKVYYWLSCQSMVARHPFQTGEGTSNRLDSDSCAVEPMPRQLLGTLKPSLAALHPFPTGEGTSNRPGSDSSNICAALNRIFKKATFTDFFELEVTL